MMNIFNFIKAASPFVALGVVIAIAAVIVGRKRNNK